jgi:ribosomal protein L32
MKPISTKLLHWIALLAILMSTLAPLVFQSLTYLSKNIGTFETEICSVDGVKIVHVNDNQSSKEYQFSFEHCPYCMVHNARHTLT